MFPKVLGRAKRTFLGHFGPVLTFFQPCWPIFAQSLSVLETVMESSMGPKPVKSNFFQKWPQILWEDQTDLSGRFGPVLTSYMAIPGTAYWTLAHRAKGSPPPPHSSPETGKIHHGPKAVKRDIFQKLPRTLWECETDPVASMRPKLSGACSLSVWPVLDSRVPDPQGGPQLTKKPLQRA